MLDGDLVSPQNMILAQEFTQITVNESPAVSHQHPKGQSVDYTKPDNHILKSKDGRYLLCVTS